MRAVTLAGLLPPPPRDLSAMLERTLGQVRAAMLDQAAITETQLHDFLCSGAMPRDLSLVQDHEVRRFDEPWRMPAPLRIR